MNAKSCPREMDVHQLAARGQWPLACPDDLAAHLQSCRSCADLLLLEESFRREKLRAVNQAKLQAPGTLWWRAQLRRRRDALERVEKPLLRAQVFAIAVYLLAVAAVILWQAENGLRWLSRLKATLGDSGFSLPSLSSGFSIFFLLISLLAGLAVLGSVLVYFASDRQTSRQ